MIRASSEEISYRTTWKIDLSFSLGILFVKNSDKNNFDFILLKFFRFRKISQKLIWFLVFCILPNQLQDLLFCMFIIDNNTFYL